MKEEQYYQFQQQEYFAQQLFQITPRFIPTSYGQVYSITAGSPGQPLILIVHGSGPKNSCQQYKPLLQQYLVRISYIQKFYLVAIDCPGYGQSIGSKQAVKTFPLKLFSQILQSLNYKQYFAMLGHSQGGAAIFNACYENKMLTEFMLMDRPVCGNIQRFRKFNIPTLLIYDIEDDGHPIWQGKLLYKELGYSQLYTYKNSEDQYWVQDNIWDVMLKFVAKYQSRNNRNNRIINNFDITNRFISTSVNKNKSKDNKNKNNNKKISNKIQEKKLIQHKYKQKQMNSSSQQKQSILKNHLSLDSKLKIIKQAQTINKFNLNLQHIKQTQKQDLISIYSNNLSEEQNIQLKQMQKQMKSKQEEFMKDEIKTKKKDGLNNKVQVDENVVLGKDIQIEQQQKKQIKKIQNISQIKQTKQKDLSIQQKEYLCSICYQTYYRPMQTNCHHIFCTKCLIQSILVNEKCPLCRTVIKKRTQRKDLNQKLLTLISSEQISKRQRAYLRVNLMLSRNRSIQLSTKQSLFTKTKKKYSWQIFVRQNPNFKFQQVQLNINMGNDQSKPVKVKSPPFVFQSRGTFSFSCEIIIKPKSKQYATLTVVYRINVQPGTHRKVVALKKKIYT